MRTSDMIKSKFWRAADLQGQPPVVLTIATVTEELLGRGSRQDVKCFLWFNEHLKGLQLNKLRVRVLEAAYGPDSDLWTGKRVRLSFDPTVEFGGRAVGGVKLQTPPGLVYTGGPSAAWDSGTPSGPSSPPQPIWDAASSQWVLPAAPAPAPKPPMPVWNEATQAWVLPQTAPAKPKDPTMGGAPTISQRIAAGAAKATEWVDSTTGEVRNGEDFDDDIPF